MTNPIIDDIESRGARLEQKFTPYADACRNVDRLVRLPGSVNWPDKDKRDKKGRKPAMARVISYNQDLTYSLSDFPAAPGRQLSAPKPKLEILHERRLTDIDELDRWKVNDRLKSIIMKGRIHGETKSGDNSSSGWLFDAVCQLIRNGVPDELIYSIIRDERFGISENVRKNGARMDRYALRQIERAHKVVAGINQDDWNPKTKDGRPRASYHNARHAILRSGLVCQYDTFHNRMIIGGHALPEYQGELTDNAYIMLRQLILDVEGFDPLKEHLRDAVDQLCLENAVDPVCDYLEGLAWDGTHRLDTMLHKYFGSADSSLNTAIGRIMMIAAVRRARQPGYKFDTIVVLEGPQGTGKSSALAILAGADNFSDQDILTLDAKAQAETIEGVWIYEISELSGLSRSDANKVKAFASRQADRARAAYARRREDHPRRCIFVGTTNNKDYLRDKTGNRRFLPVETAAIDLSALEADRNQLWAEAAHAEAAGESITLPKTLWPIAEQLQNSRVEEDPWTEVLANVKGERVGNIERIPTAKVYEVLGILPKDQSSATAKRVGEVMRALGWKGPEQFRFNKALLRGYTRPIEHQDELTGLYPTHPSSNGGNDKF
jgi:hypothetical protein